MVTQSLQLHLLLASIVETLIEWLMTEDFLERSLSFI